MRESRTYGSVRGACSETHVPTAMGPFLLHLLTSGPSTEPPCQDVRIHGEYWRVSGPSDIRIGADEPSRRASSDYIKACYPLPLHGHNARVQHHEPTSERTLVRDRASGSRSGITRERSLG
jgi:hypothetical protein